MSQIRRQSIASSFVVYIGFVIGFINTYLYARKDSGFSETQYGLISIFIAISLIMFSFSNLGTTVYIAKFFPYYKDNLPPKKNDMLSLSLIISTAGFIVVTIAGIVFKDFVIKKFGSNSPELIKYYYWLFPFGYGLTLFGILEMYAWQLHKSVFTNFLKEVQFRLFATILIILTGVGLIKDFDVFIKIFSFTYLGIAFTLLFYLIKSGEIHFTFSISRVSKKFAKKILVFVYFVYGGSMLTALASVVDSIIIAAVLPNGLAQLGVYTLAQNFSSLIQAPQRGIISSSVAALSRAWKDKDLKKINRIYHSSAINQLIFAVGMFCLIWMNFSDGVFTFHLKSGYLDARWIFFYLGLTRIIDMGTGVNSQIIGTSTFWKLEFFTGIILILITWPITFVLTKYFYGVLGPAIANLVTIFIYNFIRYWFLYKKFGLQPFTKETLYTVLIGVVAFYACYFLLNDMHGFLGIVLRSSLFIGSYGGATLLLKLSPDVMPVWHSLLKRLGFKKDLH